MAQTTSKHGNNGPAKIKIVVVKEIESVQRRLNHSESERQLLETTLQNCLLRARHFSSAEATYLDKIKILEQKLIDKDVEIKTVVEAAAQKKAPSNTEVALARANKDLQDVVKRLEKQFRVHNTAFGRAQGFTFLEKCSNEYDEEPDLKSKGKNLTPGRKRNRPTEIQEQELQDLDLDSIEHPTGPRRKKQASFNTFGNIGRSEPFNFVFTAIVSYHPDGSIRESRPSADFSASLVLSYVRDRIEIVQRTIWEGKYGEAWEMDLELDYKPEDEARCVTRVCESRCRTKWHGQGEGLYACIDCAKTGKPCFTYAKDGLRLLPLHPSDRPKHVGKKKEMLIWVNDKIELKDPDSDSEDD